MPSLDLHGQPRVLTDAAGPVALSAREAALLAWLRFEGPTPRARLAGLLWPDRSEAQARANLRQTLARLKRGAGDLVLDDAGVLQLSAVLAPTGPHSEALLGRFAYDDAPEFAAWLQQRRDSDRRERQRQWLEQGREALEAGQFDEVLGIADRLLAQHPESEEAWRLRMAAFDGRGDRASAIQAWDDCRHALRAAFGVAPSPETQALGQRLLNAEHAATPGGLPPALHRPPLAGRGDALAHIERSLALGHAVAVLGPAGIGKSRLLAEVASRGGASMTVAARPGDAVQPGALIVRLTGMALRRWSPPLDDTTRHALRHLLPAEACAGDTTPLRSAAEQREALRALAAMLGACHAKGLHRIIVDDLHFADNASLEALQVLLGHWFGQPPGGAPLPLFGARPEPGAAADQLLTLLDQSGRGTRVDLAPLGASALGELVDTLAWPALDAAARSALAAQLQAMSGGNPALALESLKCLWLDGPPTWRPGQRLPLAPSLPESVRQRLARLSPDALALAQLAAVAQADFSLPLAAHASGRSLLELAPRLTELERSQVFDGRAFAHDLVAEAVAASVPGALATALHELVARHLIATQGAAARIAHHLLAAGRAHEAGRWLLAAGHEARAAWRPLEAAEKYEAAAAALARPQDRADAFSAWRRAARCWNVLDRADKAERALEHAHALAAGDREQVLLGAIRQTWLITNQQFREAAANARALVAAAQRVAATLDPDELLELLPAAGATAPYLDDLAPLLSLCASARTRIAEDPLIGVRLAFAEGLVLNWAARPAAARTVLRQGWALAESRALHAELVNLGNQLMRAEELCGDLQSAIATCAATVEAAERAGIGAWFAADLTMSGALLRAAAGDAEGGLADIARARALSQRARADYPTILEALVLTLAGQPVQALHTLEAIDTTSAPTLPMAAYHAWASAAALRALGRDPTPWLARAHAACLVRDGLLDLRRRVIETRHADPATLARPELETLLALLLDRGLRGLARSVACAAALAAWHAGDVAHAAQHVRSALAPGVGVDPWCDSEVRIAADLAPVLAAAAGPLPSPRDTASPPSPQPPATPPSSRPPRRPAKPGGEPVAG